MTSPRIALVLPFVLLASVALAGDLQWQKDLPAAQAQARKDGKLVLCFILLGDLTAEDC